MLDYHQLTVHLNTSIIKTIQVIDQAGMRVALVIDDTHHLKGIVTDGDIRRGLLNRINLENSVTEIMHQTPTVALPGLSRLAMVDIMKKASIFHLPIVNGEGLLLGLELLEDFSKNTLLPNQVVLMAGGLGTRLGSLTEDCPKSLLKIRGKPILEIILDKFIESGFQHFKIAIHYKGDMIEDYFGDGQRFGVHIQYIKEKQRLGTAGALSLIQEKITEPFIVMNADLLTNIDFKGLLQFHTTHSVSATMCIKEYDFQVPYGVIEIANNKIIALNEKPLHKFFVNAGVYVFNPEVLNLIPKNTYFDMPSLFTLFLDKEYTTGTFPIREFWMDIGHIDDFKRANQDVVDHLLKK